jgi:hypothetical protein
LPLIAKKEVSPKVKEPIRNKITAGHDSKGVLESFLKYFSLLKISLFPHIFLSTIYNKKKGVKLTPFNLWLVTPTLIIT